MHRRCLPGFDRAPPLAGRSAASLPKPRLLCPALLSHGRNSAPRCTAAPARSPSDAGHMHDECSRLTVTLRPARRTPTLIGQSPWRTAGRAPPLAERMEEHRLHPSHARSSSPGCRPSELQATRSLLPPARRTSGSWPATHLAFFAYS